MARETVPAPLGELRAASTASGGTALTDTAAFIPFKKGTRYYAATPRNFAAAVVARITKCPWIVVLKTDNNLSSDPVDYSDVAQDGNTGTSVDLSSLDTIANGDSLLVGCPVKIRGVNCDIDATNDTASVLTVNYWNGSWTSISATDGTDVAGDTLKQDGSVTWTVPGDWTRARLRDIQPIRYTGGNQAYMDTPMYWTRWQVSVQLDTSVTLDHMLGIADNTEYAELVNGQMVDEHISTGLGGYSGLEALTDAGTGNLVVNVASMKSGELGG